MSKSDVTFRDQLITVEKTNPAYRERYEKEMAAMIAQELTTTKKLQTVGFLILSVCLAGLFGSLAVFAPEGLPWFGRVGFAAGAVFSSAFVVLYAGILKKGSLNLKKDNLASAWLGWGVVVIMGTIALVFSPRLSDPIAGVHWLVGAVFFLVAGGVALLWAHIQRSELNTREKLLEIECHLAELTEKIADKHG